ncbi:hypothetical protein [Paenibacillus sp. PDC88]|uniref:hypothetical protein n=1 Tax=Paenibacillus sp. PDC88 TaxID=1884375 RepID=UPI0008987262|nr:hypothetical protein [Paenibacillus sp. PDC88]SDX18538.1 hypothetical protein SAMN05518848_10593 [Paenibacillus sp. PDC88]
MMEAEQLLKKIEESHYWDARVKGLSTSFFGDELDLIYEDDDREVVLKFSNCYQIKYNHALNYDKEKPVRELTRNQLPYFLQNIELQDCIYNGIKYFKCKISMPPLDLEILSKDLIVLKE